MAVHHDIAGTQAARVFHALSDETRLEILQRLRSEEQCVCDLMDSLGASQSRLSFHLKVLKDAGLIRDRPEGRWVYYSLNEEGLQTLEDAVHVLRERPAKTVSRSRCC